MGKTLQKYLFAGTIIILVSCIVMAKVSHIQKEKCKLGDSIPLLSIKTDVGLRKIIGDYMNRYKKYDSYIVAKWFNTPCMNRNIEKGILVGPAYYPLIYGRKKDTIIINHRVVYLIDSLNGKRMYTEELLDYLDTHSRDTLIDSMDGTPIVDEISNFLYRAIYIGRSNGKLSVLTRPDTIFFVTRIKSPIKFTPIEIKN